MDRDPRPPPEVCVGVLGPLVLRVEDAEVAVPGARRRALLATLALARGRAVGVERADLDVADQWPDVLVRVSLIGRQRASLERQQLEVPVKQLIDAGSSARMPTLVDLHGHVGFQNIAEGTMSKETYTRENLIDHLELLAYNGVGAVIGVGRPLVARPPEHRGGCSQRDGRDA